MQRCSHHQGEEKNNTSKEAREALKATGSVLLASCSSLMKCPFADWPSPNCKGYRSRRHYAPHDIHQVTLPIEQMVIKDPGSLAAL